MDQRKLEEIIEYTRQNINRPFFIKQVFDPRDIFTWKDVDDYLNNTPHHSEVELIDSNGYKIPLNRHNKPWSGYVYDLDQIFYSILNGFSFVLLSMNRYNRAINKICYGLEEIVNGAADAHVYGGLTSHSKSFGIHQDNPNNFIVQLDGSCKWTVWDETDINKKSNLGTPVIETVMHPGDVIYVPRQVLHLCEPLGKRISVSFPFSRNERPVRTWYSLEHERPIDWLRRNS